MKSLVERIFLSGKRSRILLENYQFCLIQVLIDVLIIGQLDKGAYKV